MASGNLTFYRFEARVRFTSDAQLPLWAGNALRSGFGVRMEEIVCVNGGDVECGVCTHRDRCVYDRFYNARPPENAQVLRKQKDVSRPFVLEPPAFGKYGPGEGNR